MQHTVTVLLGETPVAFENIHDFELFDASGIDIECHRWHAKHIIEFCVRRTELPGSSFAMKLIKVADKEKLTAKFGLAVLVDADLLNEDGLAALKADIGSLGPQLKEPVVQPALALESSDLPQAESNPSDIGRSDLAPEERKELDNDIDETVGRLRTEFGGRRIPAPIDIRVDDILVIKIEHVVLSKPDTAPEAFDDYISGKIKYISFGKTNSCSIKEAKEDGSKLKHPRRITALILRDNLLGQIYDVAKNQEIAFFALARHVKTDESILVELIKISKVSPEQQLRSMPLGQHLPPGGIDAGGAI